MITKLDTTNQQQQKLVILTWYEFTPSCVELFFLSKIFNFSIIQDKFILKLFKIVKTKQSILFLPYKVKKCYITLFYHKEKRENIAFFLNFKKVIFVKKSFMLLIFGIYIFS